MHDSATPGPGDAPEPGAAPARNPERARAALERHRRRKWWMVVQQAFFPGWTQLWRGPHVVGWLGLAASVAWWGTIITLGVLFFTRRAAVVEVFTNPTKLTWLIGALLVIALICLACAAASIARTCRGRKRPAKFAAASLIGLIAIAQCAVLGFGAVTLNSTRQMVSTMFSDAQPDQAGRQGDEGTTRSGGLTTSEGRVNVLMLGGDAGSDRWGLRPDSISLVSVDAQSGDGVIIGLPRNMEKVPFAKGSPLWTAYPNGYDCGDECLLNALYTYATGHPELYSDPKYRGQDPGVLATRDAVEGVTGLVVDYTILIDMAGFADIVDAAGGVTVNIPKTIVGQDGKTTFEAGAQHLDGARALLYSRTRYDSDDYNRMTKQRLVQQALLEQANPVTLISSFSELTKAGSKYVKTDIPRADLGPLMDLVLKTRDEGITTLELVPPVVSVGNPDFDKIHTMVQDALNQ